MDKTSDLVDYNDICNTLTINNKINKKNRKNFLIKIEKEKEIDKLNNNSDINPHYMEIFYNVHNTLDKIFIESPDLKKRITGTDFFKKFKKEKCVEDCIFSLYITMCIIMYFGVL